MLPSAPLASRSGVESVWQVYSSVDKAMGVFRERIDFTCHQTYSSEGQGEEAECMRVKTYCSPSPPTPEGLGGQFRSIPSLSII